jgi:hypothetical protein
MGMKGCMLILYPKELYMKDWDSSLLKFLRTHSKKTILKEHFALDVNK